MPRIVWVRVWRLTTPWGARIWISNNQPAWYSEDWLEEELRIIEHWFTEFNEPMFKDDAFEQGKPDPFIREIQ